MINTLSRPRVSTVTGPRRVPGYCRARVAFIYKWLEDGLASDDQRSGITPQLLGLTHGTLYYGTEEFCNLLQGALGSLRDSSEREAWQLPRETHFPKNGVLIFKTPIAAETLKAVSPRFALRSGLTADDAFSMVVWSQITVPLLRRLSPARLCGVDISGIPDSQSVIVGSWVVDNGHGDTTVNSAGEELLVLASILANPGIVETETVKQHPKEKRKAKKSKRPLDPDVRVINLRRSVREGMADVAMAERTYQHRWIVKGHWRNQACGPGWKEHQRVYVAPYLKGPDSAPLLTAQKVYQI